MAPSGPLYGRDVQLSTAVDSLAVDGGAVTLTGLPGSGATTLVEHILSALRSSDLDLGDPEQWLTLDGLQLTQPGALAARLGSGDRPGLVVLEHADRVPDVVQLLDWVRLAEPGLRMLVSARGPLRYLGEQVVRLGPLPLEDPSGAGPPGPAARLFLDVAARVGAPEIRDAVALADVTEVCRLVGALPRSIEVVAARSAAFSPRTLIGLLSRPDGHLLTEEGPGHGLQPEALRWSLSLLSAAQLRTLQTLAVTQVPVSLDELTRLSGQADLAPGLSALVDAHLVRVHRSATSGTYTLPVLVREHLAAAGPPDPEAVARHTSLSVEVAEQLVAWRAAGLLSRARHRTAALEADLAAALDRALVRRSRADAVPLAVALAAHWYDIGPLPEHSARVTTAWDLVDHVDARGRADEALVVQLRAWRVVLRMALATNASEVGDQTQLPDIVREARALGPRALLAVYQVAVPACAVRLGPKLVDEWLPEARRLAHELRDPAPVVVFAAWSAVRAYLSGDEEQTAVHLRSALAWGDELPDQSLLLPVQGLVHRVSPIVPASEVQPLDELIAMAHTLRDTRTQSWLEGIAMVQALAAGKQAGAAALAVSALRRIRLRGSYHQAREVLLVLFLLASGRGELAAGGWLLALVEESIDLVWPSLSPRARQLYRAAVHHYSAQLARADAGAGGTSETSHAAPRSTGAVDGPLVVEAALAFATRVADERPAPALTAAATPTSAAAAVMPADEIGDVAGLSRRELEVLNQLADGLTNLEIAGQLHISPKTVMHHTSAIYRKLDVRSRSEAVARFLRTGGATHGPET